MELQELSVRRFVVRELRQCQDLSKLTQAAIRDRYVAHVGRQSLSLEDALLLKRIVYEELLNMEDSNSSDDEPLIKKVDRKRKRREKEEDVEPKALLVKKRKSQQQTPPDSPDSGIERAGVDVHQDRAEKVCDGEEKCERGSEEGERWCPVRTPKRKEKAGKFAVKPRSEQMKAKHVKKGKVKMKNTDSEDEEDSTEDSEEQVRKHQKRVTKESDSEEEEDQDKEDGVEKVSGESCPGRKERVKQKTKRSKGNLLLESEEEEGERIKKQPKKKEQVKRTERDSQSDSESEEEDGERIKKQRKKKEQVKRTERDSQSDSESEEEGRKKAGKRPSKWSSMQSCEARNKRMGSVTKKKPEALGPCSGEEKSGAELDTRKGASDMDSDSSSLLSLEDDKEHRSRPNQEKKITKMTGEGGGASKGRRQDEDRAVSRLKRYITLCGVRRNYKKLFDGCGSVKAKVAVLKRELQELGVEGLPSVEKCKRIRLQREENQELAELDVSNIITTQGRPRRRAASHWPPSQDAPSPPPAYRHALGSGSDSEDGVQVATGGRRRGIDWSNLRGIISDDASSD